MSLTLQKIAKMEIASPPGVFFKLKEILDDPDGTFDDISQIISYDPPLAARLLKIVNSPMYNMSSQVETISHALGIIGSHQLSDLALVTKVFSRFDNIEQNFFDIKEFWRHSLGCGFAAQLLAEHIKHENPARLYLAGMLHDIGQLVMFKEEPEQ